jgi:hypothetical protein
VNSLILPLGLLCGLALCATAVSLFAAFRAYRLLAEIDSRAERTDTQRNEQLRELDPLRATIDTLASQVRELQTVPAVARQAGTVKSGFNLSKRSQALRMHRRGESSEQIAAALDLPRQEVELLLKVHRIVIQSV